MKDFKGNKINIGDKVVFTMGGTNLRESIVTDIISDYFVKLDRIKRPFNWSQIYKII